MLLGTGTGNFGAATNFAVGAYPASVTVGDFNGDGKTDIAAANRSSNNVSVLLNNNQPTATLTIIDNDPVSVEFSAATYQVNENGTVVGVAVTINRTGDALSPGSVDVQFTDGTATGGTDFTNTTQTINFLSNETTKTVVVPITDDNLVEGNENLTLTLINPSANFVLGTQKTSTLTIVDNDNLTATIAAGATPTESGPTNGTFVITLDSPAPAGGLTVNFALAGTATTTTDYSIAAGSNISAVTATSFTIAAGTTSAVLNVAPVDDNIVDANETVGITLAAGTGYNVGAANNASLTITDNDPIINITAGTDPSESGPTNGTFNITLNGATPSPITVNFNTTGSVATLTTDYTFDLASSTNITAITATSFTIAAGVTSAILVAKPVDDAVIEAGGETVKVNLDLGTGYSLGVGNTAVAQFTPATNFSVGTQPFSVTVGDFNSDGKSDIATANVGTSNVSVLLGNGTGSFAPATNFAVGTEPRSVIVGDFNGDGKSDIATANRTTNNVSVLLGTGTGGFGAATNFAVGFGSRSVTVGDFNSDGKSDIATANDFAKNVSVLLGDGTGGFGAATNFSVGSSPLSVTVGDFNGDGKSDIATANVTSSNVSVLLGDGTGSFGAATNFSVGTAPYSVTVGDFNSDGKSDIATANGATSNVSLLLGDGTGSFAAATNFAVGISPLSVTVGDFNGDGKSDIAAANVTSSKVSVLLGDGTGSFAAATNFAAGNGPASVTVGDFNGDGKFDIAAANYNSFNVSVLLNNNQPTSTLTIADNDPVSVEFSAATYQINEDGTIVGVAITINRIGDALSPGSVDVQLTNGTATGGTDFTNTTQTINFLSNETTKTVVVPITDDALAEGNENLTLTLVNPSANFVLGTQKTSTLTIVDNDTDVTLAISPSSLTEDGAANLVYTFTRAGDTTTALTVNFNVGGDATYNTDYAVIGADTFSGSTGTVTFAANSTTATVAIDPTADSTIELDETVDLTLAAGSNYNVVTTSAVTGTITNDDAAVEFSQANYQVNEDGTVVGATVTINRTGLTNSPGSVDVKFANGSATGGTDFTNTTQTINFASGDTSKTVTIPINDDNLVEGTENFTISLANPSAGISIATQNSATVQIIDNDVPPTLSISDIAQSEGNSGTTNLNFTVSLNTAAGQTVTVNYATQDNTATTADSDYTSASGSLTFNPGETQKTVSVVVNGDTKYETDETFNLNLSNSINATSTNSVGVGTIQNDDAIPTIAIADVSQNEGQSGTTNFIFPVTLLNPSYQTVTVNYATSDGISTAGVDYNSASGTLTFNPGETQKNITVAVNGNTTVETNKNFLVNLSNASNATIVDNQAVGTIVNDDAVPTVSNIAKTGDEDTTIAFAAADFTSKFTDPNGDSLSKIKVLSLPNNGILQLNSSNVTVNQEILANDLGNLRFIAVADWNGNTSFNWSASDGANYAPNAAAVSLTINPVNDAPFVNAAIPFQTTNANNLFNFTFATDTFKDIDVGDTLTYSTTLANGNALPNWLFFNPFTRNLVGIPTSSDVGTIVLSVKATDSANASANTSFALIVNGATVSPDADCFCESIVRPDINNLPGVSVALNLVDITQFGNNSNDSITGNNGNDGLYGLGGDDFIFGKGGNDNLIGDKGNDTAFGGIGKDWIAGNQGNDVINGNEGDDVINGNEGNDTVRGGQDNDLVRGGQNDDLIYGDKGNDTLGGDKGNDTIFGDNNDLDSSNNSGRDLIFGGSGDDVINGNAGNDSIFGEDGNDIVRGGKNDDIVCGDAGDDILYGELGNDSLCGDDGNDTMYGGNGSLNPIGANGERDELCGGAGNDLLFGNEGDDKLNGEDGDDTLVGGKDNDTLIGGAGNDVLIGDLGNDLLTGGSDRDTFILTSGKGSDIITDFQDGQDLMSLGGGLSFGQLAIGQSSNNTIITVKSSNELLATFNGIQASLINQQDFVLVS
ncbi:Calx-beta domain-containing protein [Argonema antarcticum]|uniref:Calx-beta domain-containing protein n=1 Tax=Argonema antarcticum TaxID=2942763 RepID=UPI002012A344|nr:FG-GAP-like repeat-containing protein [Argonema antarcticum A004/B2]